jgi:hypothetical protein
MLAYRIENKEKPNRRTYGALTLVVVAMAMLGSVGAWGQGFGEVMAVTDGIDTLSRGSVTSGAGAANRARNVAGGGAAMPGMGMMPGMMMPMGMGMPGMGMPGAQGAEALEEETYEIPTLAIELFEAIKGQKVFDAFAYRRDSNNATVLDDIRRLQITEEEKEMFSDDGLTLGDIESGDEVYSQILPESTNEFMGGSSYYGLTRTIQMLRATQELDPLDFFGLYALTTERFSKIPSLRSRIQERDGKIFAMDEQGNFSGWSDTFLRDYRISSSDADSEFFPLYIPKPPDPPGLPAPPSPWRPPVYEPDPLEMAIDNYLANLDPDEDPEEAEAEIREKLKDADFEEEFISEHGGPNTGGGGGRGGSGGMPGMGVFSGYADYGTKSSLN